MIFPRETAETKKKKKKKKEIAVFPARRAGKASLFYWASPKKNDAFASLMCQNRH